jgi:hypothetical protein
MFSSSTTGQVKARVRAVGPVVGQIVVVPVARLVAVTSTTALSESLALPMRVTLATTDVLEALGDVTSTVGAVVSVEAGTSWLKYWDQGSSY